jgi:hypothetical protein
MPTHQKVQYFFDVDDLWDFYESSKITHEKEQDL